DLRGGELIKELVAAGSARNQPSVEFSRDGHWLATTAGGDISVYETATWQRTLLIPGSEGSSLAFDPSGPRLAVATLRGDVSIWSIPGGERAWHLRQSGDRIRHVAYSPDGAFVVAPGADGVDRIWDTHTGELQVELKNHHSAAQWVEF